MRNKTVRAIAQFLLTLYFNVEGLFRLRTSSRDFEVWQLNNKVFQLESYLINHNWLPDIEFTWLSPAFGFVLLATGVVELFTATLFYFAEGIE